MTDLDLIVRSQRVRPEAEAFTPDYLSPGGIISNQRLHNLS